MSYNHMFYAVDLNHLRTIPGSNDMTLYEAIVTNDPNVLDDDEQGALKRILSGDLKPEPKTEHLYGYALKAICAHIGEMIRGDVVAVRDHPYRSKLIFNGSPIPVRQANFPEIGYLAFSELGDELERATKTKPRVKWSLWSLLGFFLRKVFGGVPWREMTVEDIAEDMEMYAEVIRKCIAMERSLVSFRH